MRATVDFPQDEGKRLRLRFITPLASFIATRLAEVPDVLAAAWAAARLGRWVVGFVAYEAAPAFDAALRVPPRDEHLPLAAFAVFDTPANDEVTKAEGDFSCGLWRIATSEAEAVATIEALRRRIAEGDFYQVNLTTRLTAPFSGSGEALFSALLTAQPDGFSLHLANEDWEILSVSPELFFDWQPEGLLMTRPMKGTAPRHADPGRDAAAAAALRGSEKERAENLMIVDLLRNDLSRIAELGTVRVPELFALDALPTAWQMSSTVTCRTRAGIALPDVFAALFPCGSVTGAPKVAAMAAIAEGEKNPRGAYCGAIGLIRPGGHASFNVGIRTVVLDRRAGRATCGIGSGIVFDAEPRAEYAEWLVKRRFLLRATAGFELIETLALKEGRYVLRERHLARLSASAEHFGFPCSIAAIEQSLDDLASAHPQGEWRVRLLLDRQGRLRGEAYPLEPTPEDVPVVLAAQPIVADPEFLLHKTSERSAYAPFQPPPGVFDTLLWNAAGELTEFTRGNLVLALDGALVTPPTSCGLLPGVMRAELLARGEIVERRVTREDLARSEALWFINGVRGWVRVRLMT